MNQHLETFFVTINFSSFSKILLGVKVIEGIGKTIRLEGRVV